MSQQAPVLCISGRGNAWSHALADMGTFLLVDATWDGAIEAIDRLNPAAVIAGDASVEESLFGAVAEKVAGLQPYVPFIAIDLTTVRPVPNALPFSAIDGNPLRLEGRLNAALRVRALHATVLRRMADAPMQKLPDNDPLTDATVLLIGRGASYPTLSIALGERIGVVGALSIEAAAKHLNARDLDGVVIGEGFSHRVIDTFLATLSGDPRFRNLPVVLIRSTTTPAASQILPNLEIVSGQAEDIVANAIPLIRQNAFDARLCRALKSLDAGGLLDARTGLLTTDAFAMDFSRAVEEAQARGGELSAARFTFDVAQDRIRYDGARILSRLTRRMDFATLQDDGSIVMVYAETDLRTAHMITRRLASVLRHTMHGLSGENRVDPHVTLVTLLPHDSVKTLFDRLHGEKQRAVS